MRGSCAAATSLLGLAVLARTPSAQAVPVLQLAHADEELPARLLLPEHVTVDVTGTVAEVVEALLAPRGRDFLVGCPDAAFGQPAHYAVQDVPLSEALDGLLEVYGYEWGARAGTILCWPATEPRRPRKPPAERIDEPKLAPPTRGVSLALTQPTPVTAVVDSAFASGVAGIAVDEELRRWHVVGRLTSVDSVRLWRVLSGALCATTDGAGWLVVLRTSSAWRLHEALAILRGPHPPGPDGAGGLPLRDALRAGIFGRLTAQQWCLVRQGGTAEIAFRELPSDLAALLVKRAEEVASGAEDSNGAALGLDWTRPDRVRVEIRVTRGRLTDAHGKETQSEFVTVSCLVPRTDGSLLGF